MCVFIWELGGRPPKTPNKTHTHTQNPSKTNPTAGLNGSSLRQPLFFPVFLFLCVSKKKKKLRRFYPHQGGRHSLHKAEIGRGPLPSLVILKLILKTEDLVGVCNLKHRCRHMPEWYVCADGQHVTSQEGPSPVYSLLSEAWPSWAAR